MLLSGAQGHSLPQPTPRMLYGEHLFRAQDTRVSLVLENLVLLSVDGVPREVTHRFLSPLSFSLCITVTCMQAVLIFSVSPVTGLSPFQAGQQALSKPQWGCFSPFSL